LLATMMAMAVEATMAEMVMLVSDAALMLMTTQSAADGGPNGDNGSAVITMQYKLEAK
jgi:hypothetical protein